MSSASRQTLQLLATTPDHMGAVGGDKLMTRDADQGAGQKKYGERADGDEEDQTSVIPVILAKNSSNTGNTLVILTKTRLILVTLWRQGGCITSITGITGITRLMHAFPRTPPAASNYYSSHGSNGGCSWHAMQTKGQGMKE